MIKTTNSTIYHFENYIQIQKLNCLKIRFSDDELTPGLKTSRHSMRSKQNGVLEFSDCVHTQKR